LPERSLEQIYPIDCGEALEKSLKVLELIRVQPDYVNTKTIPALSPCQGSDGSDNEGACFWLNRKLDAFSFSKRLKPKTVF
jgi:hypothetical protein